MKLHHNRQIIASSKFKSVSDLQDAIDDILDDELCEDIVNLAYSEDDEFADEVFIEAKVFWDVHSSDDVQEIVLKFFSGKDLDSRGAANPNRDYFRLNGYDNVESTDYPGEIYLDTIRDDIVQYVVDHLDDRTFPEEIQELIDQYFEYVKE